MDLGPFVDLALACVHRAYPTQIVHMLHSDADAKPPRLLTPAFYGCYDWHSAVHNHWLLARAARLFPKARHAAGARAALAKSLTAQNLRVETEYAAAAGRDGFERPYGLAWLLTLALELREWRDPEAAAWAAALSPLEALATEKMVRWLERLPAPIRTGEHGQTAFSLGLLLDHARALDQVRLWELACGRARDFYLGDTAGPIQFEPSGHDFLSPCLAEADVMRRVLEPAELSRWLTAFLPGAGVLAPVAQVDPADFKLAHLGGLNLSRAWMLEGIASALEAVDARVAGLRASADAHRAAGLASVQGEHYAGSHWLPSFATYLVTGRGLPDSGRLDPGT